MTALGRDALLDARRRAADCVIGESARGGAPAAALRAASRGTSCAAAAPSSSISTP